MWSIWGPRLSDKINRIHDYIKRRSLDTETFQQPTNPNLNPLT